MSQGEGRLAALRSVIAQPFYALLVIAIATVLGLLYHYLTLAAIPSSVSDVVGLTYLVASFTLTFVTAALAAISISLLIFRLNTRGLVRIRLTGTSTAFGSTLVAFTPGCPACVTPLTIALGAVGGIIVLPLLGLEFKMISVAALVFSLYWTLGKVDAMACNMKLEGR